MTNLKRWNFVFLLVVILLLFSACSDSDVITDDESIAERLEAILEEMESEHLKPDQQTAVKLGGEQQLGQLRLIAFTCREASLGGLLLEELENGDRRVLACRVEDSIPEQRAANVMFVHTYEDQNVACVINNGNAAKLTVFTGEGEKESFALNKSTPAAYLIDLGSIGTKKSDEFSFQLEDKEGNILESADDHKSFVFSEDFSTSD